jgi:hypothetical protein
VGRSYLRVQGHLGRKRDIVTVTNIYLIKNVTRYIILDGGSFNKEKDRDCITVSVIGVKQHLQ